MVCVCVTWLPSPWRLLPVNATTFFSFFTRKYHAHTTNILQGIIFRWLCTILLFPSLVTHLASSSSSSSSYVQFPVKILQCVFIMSVSVFHEIFLLCWWFSVKSWFYTRVFSSIYCTTFDIIFISYWLLSHYVWDLILSLRLWLVAHSNGQLVFNYLRLVAWTNLLPLVIYLNFP